MGGRVTPNAQGSLPPSSPQHLSGPTDSSLRMGSDRKFAMRPGLQRDGTLRIVSNKLLRPAAGQINVLRTSLDDINERVRYRWVLHPTSHLKTAWDLLSAVAVVYYSWMIPFMLCFEWVPRAHRTNVILRVLDIWGGLDILLRFRTGIIEYGNVVMNPTHIRNAYVKSIWFPIDLVSTIPFEYIIQGGNVSTRKTVKMIKYVKLPRLLRIGRFLKYVRGYKRYSSMVIALNSVLFTAHVAGCIWVAVLAPCDSSDAMPDAPECAPDESMHVYWVALHHGIVSLLGVSSAHIEARDQFLSGGYQRTGGVIGASIYIWSSLVSLLGAVLTAGLFGTVIQIVQSWNRVEYTFRKKMDQISHEMDALSLPKSLRSRVNAYYDYLWLNSRTFSEELDLLKDKGMSVALRQQIAVYLFKDYLQKIPFFQLATDNVLGMICMQLHPVIYMPDDFVIREGDIGKELFMIVKGVVQVMPPKRSTIQATTTAAKKILLGEGDFFGEIGVVMEVERTRSVKAECMAELCILSRDGFDKILVEFPEFATAMKKLIIKRVGEMWQENGDPARMEKMTKIADSRMKRTMQAHNNIQKLRGSAHIMQAFHTRAPADCADGESLETTCTSGKEDPLDLSERLDTLSALQPIAEQSAMENSRANMQRRRTLSNMLRDASGEMTLLRMCSSMDPPDEGEAPAATAPAVGGGEVEQGGGESASATATKDDDLRLLETAQSASEAPQQKAPKTSIRKVEKALQAMEKKVERQLSRLDSKLSLLLHELQDGGDSGVAVESSGVATRSPTPFPTSTGVSARVAKSVTTPATQNVTTPTMQGVTTPAVLASEDA